MGKLILVRHGETDKNANNNLHAFNDQKSLNEKGIEQIEAAANRLSSLPSLLIFSSKEKRALESAMIISDTLKVPFEEIEGLQERNWGIFTGKPWKEVEKILKPMTLDERYNYVPQGGESWKTFEVRLVKVIRKISKDLVNNNVVIVTHGGAIRALMPFLLGIPKEESFKYDFDNASLTIFNFDGETFTKETINDKTHLVR